MGGEAIRAGFLVLAVSFSHAMPDDSVQWVRADAPPQGAVTAGELRGIRVLLCRARLADGVHPGRVEAGSCLIPQRGVVERVREFEFAVGGTAEWGAPGSGEPVVAGRQGGRRDLLICRRVTADEIQVGKAYRDGSHAGACYVGAGGKEVELRSGYEILLTKRGLKGQ